MKVIQPIIDWAGTIWTVLGRFGFATVLSALATSIAGTAWSMFSDVPLPIAVMAGLCTFVAVIYLFLVPMAVKELRAMIDHPRQAQEPGPDLAVWRKLQSLTMRQAASLWCGCHPGTLPPDNVKPAWIAWIELMKDAASNGELNLDRRTEPNAPPAHDTITRQALREWAINKGLELPAFLGD